MKKNEYYYWYWCDTSYIVRLVFKMQNCFCWMCQIPKVITNRNRADVHLYVANPIRKHRERHYLDIHTVYLSKQPIPKLKALLLGNLD